MIGEAQQSIKELESKLQTALAEAQRANNAKDYIDRESKRMHASLEQDITDMQTNYTAEMKILTGEKGELNSKLEQANADNAALQAQLLEANTDKKRFMHYNENNLQTIRDLKARLSTAQGAQSEMKKEVVGQFAPKRSADQLK
jgi:chromosome segregation ATPase